MTRDTDRARRAWALSIEALAFAVVGFVCSYTVADPDLWGHLRFGLDTLASGTIVRADAYSYLTAGHPWINHEWLAEVLMARAWRGGGAAGLVALKLAVVWGTLAVVLSHLRRRGLSPLARAIVVLAGWWLMLPWLTAFRPQAFTYLGCAAIFWLAVRAEEGYPRRLWLAVPVLAVWANLHGGFLAGLALLWAWGTAHLADRALRVGRRAGETRRAFVRVVPPLAAAVAATVLTPYGVTLWSFLRTALEPRAEIAEWNPVDVASIEGVAHAVLLVPAIAGWLASRREKRSGIAALFVCAAAAPFVARRHTPILALAVMMLAAEHMADAAARLTARTRTGRYVGQSVAAAPVSPARPLEEGALSAAAPASADRPRVSWITPAAFLLAATIFFAATWPHATRIVVRPWEYPIAAVSWLREARVTGNVVTFFDWGEYAIWHLAPRVRVSMDGRRETVYPRAVYDEDQQLLYGVGRWDALLHRGAPAAVLMSRRFAADNLLRLSPAWRVAFEDAGCTLFVRVGSPEERALLATPRPAAVPDEADVSFP